ncbi:CPBP family intramembrane glutamic endopeptidase [Celeribacter arenosi]|uniref:CAAX prenyl protease 2/Lysostaphin resistance protein A-like domain-containing protein n=1 Tax=Celeribacter arenosi TaxID=792649 RepID=A0ABP7K075_9RHOB
MTPHPYDAILQSATRRPEFWRLGVVFVLALGLIGAVTPLFYSVVMSLAPELSPFALPSDTVSTRQGGVFVVLAGFSLLLLGSILTARRLHDRSLRDITGPAALMRDQIRTTTKWIAPIVAITLMLPWDGEGSQLVAQLPLRQWLMWVPFALLGIAVQVTAEEVFFRGYLQSQIAGATGSYLSGLFASAFVFGLLHYNGTLTGIGLWFTLGWAVMFGLAAGDLTARSGTLGPAIVLHFVNNISAMLIAPPDGLFSAFGLYTRTADLSDILADPMIIVFEAAVLFVTWLAARIAIRR